MTNDVHHQRLLDANAAAASFYRRQLTGPAGDAPRRYLAERGLGHVLDRRSVWQVGYAPPGWTTLTDHLRAVGFGTAELLDAGLAVRTPRDSMIDRFRDRIMVPIRDAERAAIAFIGRSAPQAGARVPKYLNSPNTPIYRKAESLFGLSEQREQLIGGASPVIVEGPLDVLAVAATVDIAERHVTAVAACGTALTPEQASLLASSIAVGTEVIVAYDADPAGAAAAAKAYLTLRDSDLVAMGELLCAQLPRGLDPADLLRVHGPAALRSAVTDNLTPLVDQVIDTRLKTFTRVLDGADGRVAAAKSVAELVATVRRDQGASYIIRLARQLDLDPITVSIAVTDALTEAAANLRRAPTRRFRNPPAVTREGGIQPPV